MQTLTPPRPLVRALTRTVSALALLALTAGAASAQTNPTVTLSASPTTVSEDGGTSTITATLSQATNEDVTVGLGLADNTAESGDFSISSGTITVPAGQTTGTVTLTASADADTEDETVTVLIDTVTGGGATESGDQRVALTIQDNDGATGPTNPTVTLSASPTTVSEDGGTSTITATLSQATNEDVTVSLGLADNTAESGDFSISSGTITVPAGQTTGTVTLTASADADTEDETVTVLIDTVTGGGATESGDQRVALTIQDNDGATGPTNPTVTLSVSDNDITEGESTTLTVSLSGGATANGPVEVELAYNPARSATLTFTAPNSITIPEGQNSATATLQAADDDVDENDLTATVSISRVNGNADEDGEQAVTVTIRDNDVAGGGGGGTTDATVSFAGREATVGEDAGTYDLTLVLSEALDTEVSATVTLSSGDAADLGGFRTREVTIPAGTDTVSVSVSITDDEVEEEDETFTFQLSSDDLDVDLGTFQLTVTDDDAEDGTTDPATATITEYDSIVGDDDDRFVEVQSDEDGPLTGLFLVYLDADSTVIEVDSLGSAEVDADGFLVISEDDDEEDTEESARSARLVPDDFFGVALVRGEAPEVGDTLDFDGDDVVDVLFVDEAAAAAEQGLDPEDGSIQRRDDGRPAFAARTPGEENEQGNPVSTPVSPEFEEALTVFPNPSAGRATAELSVATAQRVEVAVFDVLGRRVAVAYDGEARPGAALRVSLSGASLAPGVYVVRVAGETFTESRRLTVTR